MSEQRTPGTWTRGKGGYASGIWADDGNDAPRKVCELYYGGRSREEIAANGNLIAAAPDMLDVLERMLAMIRAVGGDEPMPQWREAWTRDDILLNLGLTILAAIAKARGQEPRAEPSQPHRRVAHRGHSL